MSISPLSNFVQSKECAKTCGQIDFNIESLCYDDDNMCYIRPCGCPFQYVENRLCEENVYMVKCTRIAYGYVPSSMFSNKFRPVCLPCKDILSMSNGHYRLNSNPIVLNYTFIEHLSKKEYELIPFDMNPMHMFYKTFRNSRAFLDPWVQYEYWICTECREYMYTDCMQCDEDDDLTEELEDWDISPIDFESVNTISPEPTFAPFDISVSNLPIFNPPSSWICETPQTKQLYSFITDEELESIIDEFDHTDIHPFHDEHTPEHQPTDSPTDEYLIQYGYF